jgi:hypothetical protein
MEKIPITFEFECKEYNCYFNKVSGSANNSLFHLMNDNYYCGQLFFTGTWQFYGNRFNDMGETFGSYLIAWYDSSKKMI